MEAQFPRSDESREREDQPMRDYAAFLRAVSPMNAKMPELKKCFEAAGFVDVKTLLSSGNLVFRGRAASESSLERHCEARRHIPARETQVGGDPADRAGWRGHPADRGSGSVQRLRSQPARASLHESD